MNGRRIISILAFTVLCGTGSLHAQMNNKAPDEFRGLDRWAFKTNLLGWAATLPNFTAEVDLSPSPYNRMTLSVGAEYNWETRQNKIAYHDFNLFTLRPEFRWYHRTPDSDDPEKYARRLKGAYYFGAYVDAGTYTLKLSDIGHQGIHTGFGFSFGYAMPMYQYKGGGLDVEFGGSVGLALATADAFTINEKYNRYDHVETLSKGYHLIPYPVISEISIAFVWRKTSIRHKYIKVDRIKAQERADKKEKRHAKDY